MAGAQDTHSWTVGEVELERKGPECPSGKRGKWMWGVLLKPLALVTLGELSGEPNLMDARQGS